MEDIDFATRQVPDAYYNIDTVLAAIVPPIEQSIAEELLMEAIVGMEVHAMVDSSTLPPGLEQDPQIAAWLLACLHFAGYTRCIILSNGDFPHGKNGDFGKNLVCSQTRFFTWGNGDFGKNLVCGQTRFFTWGNGDFGKNLVCGQTRFFTWEIFDPTRPLEEAVAREILSAVRGTLPLFPIAYAIVSKERSAAGSRYVISFTQRVCYQYTSIKNALLEHPRRFSFGPLEVRNLQRIEFSLMSCGRITSVHIPFGVPGLAAGRQF